ncbi:4a-hydroxytetrahydrobiopterin dehydratase [Hylemonella gracilis]|uniref:Putative pterin-4-alpha-carbinolamine dehydratase n=1 Tax=Hylemonella gracilis TaxID=80880 RepID=A0A4P6UNE5_9BURK|nr:4a-hydroxytetrahydrobiopterin dehydratase [Hylemonella gracilis]QBK06286.1 4a-hydroxytetrahydrobiopterin dehydratase [Hylemonella gracilis]QBK06684.1 4a-hydroxytetrahydrobiopterin dehydratase [Hylemonella gracilis]
MSDHSVKLDEAPLRAELATLPEWTHRAERGGLIAREFRFADFTQAFGFMAQVALVAEKHNHHPEWFNVYNRVSVVMTTHDVQGLSMKDIEMARYMDRCAATLLSAAH